MHVDNPTLGNVAVHTRCGLVIGVGRGGVHNTSTSREKNTIDPDRPREFTRSSQNEPFWTKPGWPTSGQIVLPRAS